METTIKDLLKLLAYHKGTIVSTASLNTEDINQARASNRMYIDDGHLGYVWMPELDRLPETDEEVEQFEKWYPLHIEMPEDLKNWRPWMGKIKKS